ncbi:MAG TPA: DNA-3-methyladenine glycosylase [Actinomycetota bacterium]|nr:DNA-3-methyladenine glycosylase [Actinomycetota bacterium]
MADLRPLSRRFYARDPALVARDILGRLLVRETSGERLVGRIVEAEAYATDDPASHSYRGETRRNATMFGPPAHAYVYVSHGIHHCLNVTTGHGNAVLLRAIEPLEGLEWMVERRGVVDARLLCAGPGRLCEALGVGLADDGADLTTGEGLWLARGVPASAVVATPRVGIRRAADVPWRFVVRGSRYASRPAGLRPRRPA